MKKVYLIRHGESEDNANGNVISGISNVALSDNGRDQCQKLREIFNFESLSDVFSSPLPRAIESAKIIFPEFVSKLRTAPNLTEIDYGEYEEYDIENDDGSDEVIRTWNSTPAELTFPAGDNVRLHAEKVLRGLLEVINLTGSKNCAVISHRTTIRLIIAKIMNIDLNLFRSIPCSNGGVTVISVDKDKQLNLITINSEVKLMNN